MKIEHIEFYFTLTCVDLVKSICHQNAIFSIVNSRIVFLVGQNYHDQWNRLQKSYIDIRFHCQGYIFEWREIEWVL